MARENLAAARKRRGLTQAALAEQVGIRREAYKRYEGGQQTPNVELAIRISQALGTPVEVLFSASPSPVLDIRLTALADAIRARDWEAVEFGYDRLRSALDRELGVRDRETDRLRQEEVA